MAPSAALFWIPLTPLEALAMMLNNAESKYYVWFAPVVLAGCWASCSAARGVAAFTPLRRERRSPEPEPV